MSLTDFQRAFADLISSPERCLAARADSHSAFASYDLTEREQYRLNMMVHNRAMSINCTLYRVNRLTPVYSVLPLTCAFLGDRLLYELKSFWESFDDASLQYRREAWRFGHWLQKRIASGLLEGGPIEDAIQFELAAFDIRTAPHLPDHQDEYPHPRKRLICFSYDPHAILDPANASVLLRPSSHWEWVLLDATSDALAVYRLPEAPNENGDFVSSIKLETV